VHILPQLRKLERKWERELVVVGVHSPKFVAERDSESVRQAIRRLEVGHPVVNDRDFRVWQAYAVRAWPTLMFIDPQGRVIGRHEGEFPLEPLDRVIADMVREFDGAGVLDRRPLALAADDRGAATPLRFPGKVLVDAAAGRLVVSDSGHHRLVVADLDGRVRLVVGGGAPGLRDGDAAGAAFHGPQGLALRGDLLYVADAENHALRAVDLATGRVTTVAGTGEQLMGERVGGPARQTRLSSPWALALLEGVLYVAMAGTHQIWALPLDGDAIAPHAGTGREALEDGPRPGASMNQPSGLTTDGRRLYVADSEASAIRVIDPGPRGEVRTIVGEGLFEFGDRDGVGPQQVRLQHPLGVAWHDGAVHVADTYNHKIKRLDPATGECRTVAGTGEPGHRDGPAGSAAFSEPGGLAAAGGRLYVADTNNHAIRILDPVAGQVTTLQLRGLEPPQAARDVQP
jgi:DNA-binding beta-propeller fold protein YncE